MKNKLLASIFIFSLFVFTVRTHAAGGDMFIDVKNRGIIGVTGAPITVTVYDTASPDPYVPKQGASVTFEVQNPGGDRKCEAETNVSDAYGQIHATCYSDTPEVFHLYVTENGYNNAASATLYFDQYDEEDRLNPLSYREEIMALKERVEELREYIEGVSDTIEKVKDWIGL